MEPSAAGPKTKRVFNLRLLVETLIVAAILGPAIYLWYSWQLTRIEAAMLERAKELSENKDDRAAAQYYFQYLKLRPEDADVQVLLTESFDRAAVGLREKGRAVQYYYQALGVAPPEKQRDLRRRLGELLLQLQRFTEAEDEARTLIEKDKNDAAGWRILALALHGQTRSGEMGAGIRNSETAAVVQQARKPAAAGGGSKSGEKGPAGKEKAEKTPAATVGEVLRQARERNPGDIEIATTEAVIYRDAPQLFDDSQQSLSDAERQEKADRSMDAMVAANPKSAKVYLSRYRYRLRYNLPGAKDDLAAALKYGPDDLEVVLQAASQSQYEARALQRQGGLPEDVQACWAQARAHFEHAIAIAPSDESAYLGLGEVYVEQGKPDRAVETWRLGLEKVNKESIELNGRLANQLTADGRLDEAEKVLGVLTRTIDRISPSQPSPIKLAMKRQNDLLRGKWLVRKGQYFEAISLLRLVAAGQRATGPEAAHSLQAWQLLGIAYGAINQWDQSATAYEQAAAIEPRSARLRVQAGGAWTTAGRPDAAVACYRQALAIEAAPETWLALAWAEFQKQVRLAKEERNWDAFEKAVAEAKRVDGKNPLARPWRLDLCEVNSALVRGEEQGHKEQAVRDALTVLRAAEKKYPEAEGLLQVLIPTYERLEQPADADRALNNLAKMKDQAVAACILKAGLLADRKQYDEVQKVLTDGVERAPAAMRPALWRELIRIEFHVGRWKQAREQLVKLHESDPASSEWVLDLAELALETGNLADLERWEKELRKLEGSDGLFSQYYEARRLLAQADGPNDAKLVRVSELQAHVQTQRPAWSKAYVLQGMLGESRGKFEQAAEAYQEAIRLGERQPLAYERLISLLTQLDRAPEADQYLRLLQDRMAGSEMASLLEIAVATKRGQADRALEAARRGVGQRPKDPLAHLWLGQVLLTNGKNDEAEAELKQAVELAPDDARTLGGLFAFQVRTKQPDRARETLRKVAANQKLSEDQRESILARGYELLGDREQANLHYRQAAKLSADDPAAQLRLAQYLLRTSNDRSEVEQMLRGVLQRWPDSSPARRMLAELLMERGGEKEWQEAVRLAEQAGAGRTTSDVDRRMQASLLAQRGGRENIEKAKQILEELVADPKRALAMDRQMLARLYETEGKLEAARQQYLKLVSRENPGVALLGAYVELLLRHDRHDEADPWLKKLESLMPDDLSVTLLRARWFHAAGQDAKIEPMVEALGKKLSQKSGLEKQQEVELAQRIGGLYSTVGQHPAAERWYRRLVELAPERYEPLAVALARQGRMREAIELCQKAAQSDDSARPALGLATVLMLGKPTADDFQLAEATLTKAVANHKDDVDLLYALANVRVVQHKADEAVQLYQQILALKPMHVATLNNLATLLGEQPGKGRQALQYIELAIQVVGPQPGLLDTKGMILVFDEKAGEAVPLLEQAAAAPRSDPRYHFHLAVAYDRTGQAEKARAALSAARKGELTRQVLTSLDQQMLADLEKKFNP